MSLYEQIDRALRIEGLERDGDVDPVSTGTYRCKVVGRVTRQPAGTRDVWIGRGQAKVLKPKPTAGNQEIDPIWRLETRDE